MACDSSKRVSRARSETDHCARLARTDVRELLAQAVCRQSAPKDIARLAVAAVLLQGDAQPHTPDTVLRCEPDRADVMFDHLFVELLTLLLRRQQRVMIGMMHGRDAKARSLPVDRLRCKVAG